LHRLHCGILTLCIVAATVACAQGSSTVPLEMSLAQAVEHALAHNLDLRLAALALDQAQANLRRAEIVGEMERLEDARRQFDAAAEAYNDLEQELVTKVQNAYQEILYNTLALERQAAAMARAADQLRIDDSKFAAGLLSSLDIMRAELSLANAENNYASSQEALVTVKMRFNELLGLPLGTDVVLTDSPFLAFVPFEYSLEECYACALEVDQSVRSARKSLQEAEDEVLTAQNSFVPLVQREHAAAALQRAEIELEKAEIELYFRVRTEYLNLRQAAENVNLKAREVELEQRILEAEQIRYAAGVVSNAQIVAQQERLAVVEQEYSKALLDYSLGRSKLLRLMGMVPNIEE
jgi:outer membrane protein